jgi:protein-L-isoaspartate(D-aspartate) O-methyltransferase
MTPQSETSEAEYAEQRRQMVTTQLRGRGIRDQRLLDAMLSVPRHEFVPPEYRTHSYADEPVPIGEGQTISQPYMVAAMLEVLRLKGNEKVLEVGAGSGYAAAILSRLARTVYTIESHPAIALAAQERLTRLSYDNVAVHTGDGSAGLAEVAPFDAIVVAAAAPNVPEPLVSQLADGGRMAVPVGAGEDHDLVFVEKRAGHVESRVLYRCRFVPLIGRFGFSA